MNHTDHVDAGLPIADRKTTARALWRTIRGARVDLSVSIVLLLLAAQLAVLPAFVAGWIADHLTNGTFDVTTSVRWLLALLGAWAVSVGLVFVGRVRGVVAGQKMAAALREEFTDDTLRLSVRTVERVGLGPLAARITGDVPTVANALQGIGLSAIVFTLKFVVYSAAVFWVSWPLGCASLVGVALVTCTVRWYVRRAEQAYVNERSVESGAADALLNLTAGARTVECFNLIDQQQAHVDRMTAQVYHSAMRTLWLRIGMRMGDFNSALSTAVLLALSWWLVPAGVVSTGQVLSAALLTWSAGRVLMILGDFVEALNRAGAALSRLVGVRLAADPAPALTPPSVVARPTSPESGAGQLAVNAVSFRYTPTSAWAVRNVTLNIQPGEHITVVGASGAGKTTLMRLLAGFDAPTTGQVTLHGVPVTSIPADELARDVMLVTQEHHVFLGTLADNLRYANPDATDTDMLRVCDQLGVVPHPALPQGLATPLRPQGTGVPADVAQRISLARVVLANPHTLILDEATSMLTGSIAEHTETALAQVLAGRTVITVAHELRSVETADRVVLMAAGQIVQMGPHHDLVATPGPYADLWHTWNGQ